MRRGRLAKNCTVPVLPCPLDPEADDATLMQQVTGYYQERLKAMPVARAYLAGRGLDSDDLISRYQTRLCATGRWGCGCPMPIEKRDNCCGRD